MSKPMSEGEGAPPTWDSHAPDYQRLFAPLTGHVGRMMLRLVEGRLPASPRILDIGCGPGDLALAAAKLCAARQTGAVLATDLSATMVSLADRALAPYKAYARCEVRDGQALGLDGDEFDAAFSCFGIFLFPDRPAGWRSAAQALRPGGRLIASVWRGPDHNELARAQMEPLMTALPARLTDPLPRPGWADIMTAEGLAEEVTSAAPLTDVEIHVIDTTIVLANATAMWRGMAGNPMTGALIARCTSAERAAAERAVVAFLERRAGGPDRPLVINTSCHVLIARRA